jgi:N-glycosylase/DNA lyase
VKKIETVKRKRVKKEVNEPEHQLVEVKEEVLTRSKRRRAR